uniref:Uncharacterized protein n=1 Tax=Timema tahoe TaxID=61484 RepID=A0A7R9I961_9NEOP|nr:unnamed protein product [Timema tahoe]
MDGQRLMRCQLNSLAFVWRENGKKRLGKFHPLYTQIGIESQSCEFVRLWESKGELWALGKAIGKKYRPFSVLFYKTERTIQCAMSFSRCTWVILVPNLVAIVLICGTLLYYWAEPPVKHVATLRRNRERTFVRRYLGLKNKRKEVFCIGVEDVVNREVILGRGRKFERLEGSPARGPMDQSEPVWRRVKRIYTDYASELRMGKFAFYRKCTYICLGEGGRVKNNLGKTILSTPDWDLRPDFPVIGILVYWDSDALDNAATEADR